ncbi:MAG: sigma 54-interacting transcriptional regulator [Thermodesulfobacteriota bacterium]
MKHVDVERVNARSLLEGVPHAAALLDESGRLLLMNAMFEAMTGRRSEEVRGVAVNHVLQGRLARRDGLFPEALAAGGRMTVETDAIDAARKKVPIRLSVTPFTDSAGARGLLCCVEDISVLQRLDELDEKRVYGDGLLGHSPVMRELRSFLPVLARTDATVLITGETGTGKDLLAKAIHDGSKRASCPFVKVNCGALPEALLESELFGHVRGAFTGAHADKPGMFRLAQGGTLFLTEIGDLPLPLQVKLLTVLDDREFYPVGSSRKVQVDVRVVAGTHRHLERLIGEGLFREDLYFRLNVLRAHMPPLRERQGDVRLLAEHFLHRFARELGKEIKRFAAPVMPRLLAYDYPGNVRELRNIVEYAVNICQEREIGLAHLPDNLLARPAAAAGKRETGREQPRGRGEGNPPPAAAAVAASAANWGDAEKRLIMDALLQCRGNRGEVASRLGWGRSTLWRKMKQHGII